MYSDEKDNPGDRGLHQERVDYVADPVLVGIVGRPEVHLSLEICGPSSAARRRYKNLHQYRKTVPGRAGGVADR